MAYLFFEQLMDEEEAQLPFSEWLARYGLVDTSPMWGSDWLWNAHTSVPGGDALLSLHVDVQTLICVLLEFQSMPHDEDKCWFDADLYPQDLGWDCRVWRAMLLTMGVTPKSRSHFNVT